MDSPEETASRSPIVSPFGTLPEDPDLPSPPPLVPGERIGRYRLVRMLGEGGFGQVYLAHDDDLDRPVAIKVPLSRRLGRLEDVESYLAEARTLARLEHPHIVPVYDFGRTENGLCYVVSKFIEGTDLAEAMRWARPSHRESAGLVAAIAEALHHAHTMGLVHRDVKPANILIDAGQKAYLADFGLALKDLDFGKGPGFAGTPAYMSPEQARGEGHRVDGRSDIFSLGVVFYELLAGRRPFHAETRSELLERIASADCRPPRQWVDTIARELERICLKALSRRAAERYTTAKDLAEDLRFFLNRTPETECPTGEGLPHPSPVDGRPPTTEPQTTPPATAPALPPSDNLPLKVVPKGLRSFDQHDSDFFLDLLPGPRDRDGLPESLRFWKNRIEQADPDRSFSVGLIYGPSGCGKSSLVKAGLLPRLASSVIPIYVEATGEETEARLLKGLRRLVPDLPGRLGLVESLIAMRRGPFPAAGRKVLLVLDQLEQWLHARRSEENTELVQALRQCDGRRVQCLVMVRDDFWLAISRFMRAMEIAIDGENSRLVDLFDPRHAKEVLTAFGRAFGALPEGRVSTDQEAFLEQAIAGLAQQDKVVSVRLSLFAEMIKGRPWTPATLRQVGGMEGVGVTFLEETFTSSTAAPQHRLHEKAAQAVLKDLLPETGTEIKGHMRPERELRVASGYANRSRDFEELLRILDREVRLITPIDPADEDQFSASQEKADNRYYQLTHDYLVPSLRDWLTRKQKATRRGRTELLLTDRAAEWNARPEDRQLPSFWQWCKIRGLTQNKSWTPAQYRMMRKAARYHAARGSVLVACLLLLGYVGWEGLGRLEAQHLSENLRRSTTADVPGIIKGMAPYRRWIDPLLHEAYEQARRDNRPRGQLHASLALLPRDPGQVPYLRNRLLVGDPEEVSVIREMLRDHPQQPTDELWALLEDSRSNQDQGFQGKRLRAACALALFAPGDDRWKKISLDVMAILVTQETFEIAGWTELLRPVKKFLFSPLAELITDEKRGDAELKLIATIFGKYADDRPGAYEQLEKRLAQNTTPATDEEDNVSFAKRKASLGIALLVNGRGEQVWPLLQHTPDPTVRSYMIKRSGPCGVDWKLLTDRLLTAEKDVSVKRAIVLSLGQYGTDRLSVAERQKLQSILLQMYRNDADPGVHSAIAWLMRNWGAENEIQKNDEQLMKDHDRRERIREELPSKAEFAPGKPSGWYVNSQCQTMVVIARPGKMVDHSFELCATDVTIEEFRRFREDQHLKYEPSKRVYAPSNHCPAIEMTWYDAAAYCNWLSRKEKLETCYEEGGKGLLKLKEHFLNLSGYRLPTEMELEFACRANSTTSYAFGRSAELIASYGWYASNSVGMAHPVGWRKPNDFGLFDMYGNVWQWCNDVLDPGGPTRVALGGAWFALPGFSHRRTGGPDSIGNALGFRVARIPVARAR